jgi:hypothetical protein
LEEAETMIRYAWAANWPIRGTLAVTMNEDKESEFEFSVTYTLEKDSEPTWECLWALMCREIVADGITLPVSVSRERLDYLASCEKVNQSIRILWRRGRKSAEDHGLPVYSICGTKAEIKLRDIERLGCGVEGIMTTLYNGQMTVIMVPSQEFVYNAVMGRPGEQIVPPMDVTAKLVESSDDARQFNEGIRGSAEIVANADKGFGHYLKYFRADRPVTAAVRVESGKHSEYGWGVYFEQGGHRCRQNPRWGSAQ